MERIYINNSSIQALVLFLCLLSCNKEDNQPQYYYPSEVTIPIGSIYSFGLAEGSDDWIISIQSGEIVNIKIEENTLFFYPQKLGNTRVIIMDSVQKEIFSCKVEVVQGKTEMRIDSLSFNIEITDSSYMELIKDEITSSHPFPVGTVYNLTYDTRHTGILSIFHNSNPSKELFTGTFLVNENDSITFFYASYECTYYKEYKIYPREGERTPVDIYLIKDCTQYFIDKYPQAGVHFAKGYQIMNWL